MTLARCCMHVHTCSFNFFIGWVGPPGAPWTARRPDAACVPFLSGPPCAQPPAIPWRQLRERSPTHSLGLGAEDAGQGLALQGCEEGGRGRALVSQPAVGARVSHRPQRLCGGAIALAMHSSPKPGPRGTHFLGTAEDGGVLVALGPAIILGDALLPQLLGGAAGRGPVQRCRTRSIKPDRLHTTAGMRFRVQAVDARPRSARLTRLRGYSAGGVPASKSSLPGQRPRG